jgi:hypothetical protein
MWSEEGRWNAYLKSEHDYFEVYTHYNQLQQYKHKNIYGQNKFGFVAVRSPTV